MIRGRPDWRPGCVVAGSDSCPCCAIARLDAPAPVLAQAEVVDLAFHPPEKLVSVDELRERVALIERLLAETPDPFQSEFDRAFVRVRDRILAEWQAIGQPEVLLDLIGRGPGTTPAGDDTLVGLLAGLEVLAAVAPDLAGPHPQATRHVPQAPLARQMSLLSAQALKCAACGRFSQPLLNLQRALAKREAATPEVMHAGAAALPSGHTTGWSGLVGLAKVQSVLIHERTGNGFPVVRLREA